MISKYISSTARCNNVYVCTVQGESNTHTAELGLAESLSKYRFRSSRSEMVRGKQEGEQQKQHHSHQLHLLYLCRARI